MSNIKVICPHCQIEGRLAIPPHTTIMLGTCPHCDESVAVFFGQVLPLDKDIMDSGAPEDKRDHILERLNDFLGDWLVMAMRTDVDEENTLDGSKRKDEFYPLDGLPQGETFNPGEPISEGEVRWFVNAELRLLDDADYFHAVFNAS